MDGSPGLLLLWVFLLIGAMYFFMVRPQQKRVKAHRDLIESLSIGDEIVTIGGIHGNIQSIDDDSIAVKVTEDVTMTFSRNAMAAKMDTPADDVASDEKSEEASV